MASNIGRMRTIPLTELLDAPTEARFDQIYTSIEVARGTAGCRARKSTSRGRLTAVDDVLIAEIERLFPIDHQVSLHDMAASSAITSLELFVRVKARRPAKMRASDYYNTIYAVRVGPWTVFFDVLNSPIQFVWRAHGVSARRGSLRFLLSPLIVPTARKRMISGRYQEIVLFHPDAIAAVCEDFVLARENFSTPEPRQYDVVRIINPGPHEPLLAALPAIARTVSDGGLLVLGRANIASQHLAVTIFRRCGNRFHCVRELGEGYKFRQDVLSLVIA